MTIDKFENFQYVDLNPDDILICAFGYEARSYYLLQKNFSTRNKFNTFIVQFDDLDVKALPPTLLRNIENLEIGTITCSYAQGRKFQEGVIKFLSEIADISAHKIYIDYSSMPRNWYCYLPYRIEHMFCDVSLELFFLYVPGIYPEEYESYPTAGIDGLVLFSGGALPRIDAQTTHLIALSYDTTRTQGLLDMLEPEFLMVCYVYDTPEKKAEIEHINEDIIRRASVSIAFPIDDFVSIMKKLNEVILEQVNDGQIVIIPDGPKPLILAMSLASLLAGVEDGITCLHVNRSEQLENNKIPVSALENIVYSVKIGIN